MSIVNTQKSGITAKRKIGKIRFLIPVIISLLLIPFFGLHTLVNADLLPASPTPVIQPNNYTSSPNFGEEASLPTSDWGSPTYDVPLALTGHDHFYFSRPLSIGDNHKLNVDYRYSFYYPDEDVVHTGIDISGAVGDPVLAAAAGKVIFAGNGILNGANDPKDPYGLAVMIRHSFSYEGYTIYSVYAHLAKATVTKGDWVESGDQIGAIGMTGNTSGPHLHFEIRIENAAGDKVQNPELWLAPLIGHGVLAGRVETTYGMLLTTKTLWLKSLETGKTWNITTYAPKTKQLDDYYQENFTVGDLPVGLYEISTYYNWGLYKQTLYIAPGAINYISFHGSDGFSTKLPANESSTSFLPTYK